jgi:S-adenosylmethionine synthetase
MNSYIFTSESVTEGHPDKLCDRISDSVLDACLAIDPKARVACETFVKGFESSSHIILGGEITLSAEAVKQHGTPDYEAIARQAALDIGYTSAAVGMDANKAEVQVLIGEQSEDIGQGVNEGEGHNVEQGAGDQGLMFGYASNETPSYMPLPIELAHRLARQLALVRHNGLLKWVRPDGKTQVSVRYEDDLPVEIETVLISTQHDDHLGENEEAALAFIREGLYEHVIRPILPTKLLPDGFGDLVRDGKKQKRQGVLVNPTGVFIVGGPHGDAGLTGRKIIVDTYGGMGRHGGGAFSGKDPSKVDRSAAYAARWVAKNLVAAGAASRCEIQIAYAIGQAEPVSIHVNTFGTGDDAALEKRVREGFDLRPKAIIEQLDLLRPIYAGTAAYGHFGPDQFPWEQLNRLELFS